VPNSRVIAVSWHWLWYTDLLC